MKLELNLKFNLGKRTRELIRDLFQCASRPKIVGKFTSIHFVEENITVKGESMAEAVLHSRHKATLEVQFTDAGSNPAVIDGAVNWQSSNENILTVTPLPELSDPATGKFAASVAAIGPVGSAQIAAVADAQEGEGVENIAPTINFTVVAGRATSASFNVGPEQEIEEPSASVIPTE